MREVVFAAGGNAIWYSLEGIPNSSEKQTINSRL